MFSIVVAQQSQTVEVNCAEGALCDYSRLFGDIFTTAIGLREEALQFVKRRYLSPALLHTLIPYISVGVDLVVRDHV